MRVCSTCGYRGLASYCPNDGSATLPVTPAGVRSAESETESELASREFVGRVLEGRYRVDQLLERGGMGWVFRATHLAMEQTVAVKVLRRDLVKDEAFVERFRAEARACSRLRHHHTIKVHDFGISEDGYPFLVMEFLEGRSLDTALRREGPLPAARVIRIAQQICKSLQEAHSLGMVHRDLKPANVFLCRMPGESDYVKLLDFGIAKVVEERRPRADSRPTASGKVVGTPQYMSPEQVQGAELDGRSDLYALGIVMYELLAGYPPFDGAEVLSVMVKHVVEAPRSLSALPSLRAPVPPGLVRLVDQLLEKTPERRPAAAEEVLLRLQELEDGAVRLADPARFGSSVSVAAMAARPAEDLGAVEAAELALLQPLRPGELPVEPPPAEPPQPASTVGAPNDDALRVMMGECSADSGEQTVVDLIAVRPKKR